MNDNDPQAALRLLRVERDNLIGGMGKVVAERDELRGQVELLREALAACERSLRCLVETQYPSSPDWINVRAARHLARTALTDTEPKG